MNAYQVLASGFRYPEPGRLKGLQEASKALPAGSVRDSFERFLDSISLITLEEWEELHTRTLDLSPLFAPYVGYVTWGESYERGAFLATLNRAERDSGIDSGGELPDHLDPILRYLGTVSTALPELVEILPAAVSRMLSHLRRTEKGNPYVHLLEATRRLVSAETVGRAR